jgi:electron transfer flavoprotein alpha subunit
MTHQETQDDIWVFAEQRNGVLHDVSLELLGKARDLAEQGGNSVGSVLLGHQVGPLAQTLIRHGADRVFLVDDVRLNHYRLIPYAATVTKLIRKHDPSAVLMGASAMGVELAPRVAARLETGLSAHCVDLRLDENGRLLQVVPGWGGGVIATIACPAHRPQMATVMPGAMRALNVSDRQGQVIECAAEIPHIDLGPEVIELSQEASEELPLEKADIVVAGGWGVGSKENWSMIEALANALGGAVGATRPPVDEGWAKEGQMIGQSGKTVRPALYIGIGISGVMHHVVGMDQAKLVIAINNNSKAEIFNVSDLIVVADFKKIVPLLIEEIRVRRKSSPAG